jgi:uncharacterized repeat protein (TIGR01451 family)
MRPLRPVALAVALLGSSAFGNSVFVIKNSDPPNAGFNDPTPAEPVGGNPGTTVGEQRRIVFEFAAAVWGATLVSPVPITIDASFASLSCSPNSGVLGSSAPMAEFADFPHTPLPGYLFAASTANAIAGVDLDPASAEIVANFNQNLGTPGCLAGSGWYYGLDGHAPDGQIPLATVLLHEFGHGLGYLTFEDGFTGANLRGKPDAFEHDLLDDKTGKTWDQLTNGERIAAALDPEHEGWQGAQVRAAVPGLLHQALLFSVDSPSSIAGDKPYGTAQFGAPPDATLEGTLVLARDRATGDAYGCGPMQDLRGKLAFVNRGPADGGCTFLAKAANAQAAGAIAMVVGDYSPADATTPIGMAGRDTTITLPSIILDTHDSDGLRSALASGPAAVRFRAGEGHQGADDSSAGPPDRMLVYTPAALQPGSSVSHWSMSAAPSLLMQPFIHDDTPQGLDLTYPFMQDIGWQTEGVVSLGIEKIDLPSVNPGGQARYVIVVVNHGTSAIENVSVTATAPEGLSWVSNQGACSTGFPCEIPSVPADSVAALVTTWAVPAEFRAPGQVVTSATMTYAGAREGDPDLSASYASAVLPANDLGIAAQGPTKAKAGGTVKLDVTITNAGPSNATGVGVVFNGAEGLTLSSYGGDCSGTRCDLGSLPVGGSKHVTASFAISADATGSVAPSLTVTSSGADPQEGNDTALVSITVEHDDGGGCTAPGTAAALPLAVLAAALWLRRARA